MGELYSGPKQPLKGADTESYLDLHVVPLDTDQKERVTVGTWHIITRLTLDGRSSLAFVGCPTRREELP